MFTSSQMIKTENDCLFWQIRNLFSFFNWEILVKKYVDSYLESSWKHVVNSVIVNKIMHEVDELTNIVSDVIGDPTLPRSEEHPCPKCKHREAVFFQVLMSSFRKLNYRSKSMNKNNEIYVVLFFCIKICKSMLVERLARNLFWISKEQEQN